MVVLVTGSSGQLGQALQYIAPNYSTLKFYFAPPEEADITNRQSIITIFNKVKPDFCINAAAYTAVDKAESEPESAYAVNVTGAKYLAESCKEFNTTLLHISTDFVFDGLKNIPYTEDDEAKPKSIYGKTKLEGENEIKKILKKYYIIRTSWLYSQFANNFMKTMIRLGNERTELSVVDDQMGTPTSAIDLAEAILAIITANKEEYGIYHYSNAGETTWYGFAKKIFELGKITINLNPIPTSAYPTPAERPVYSVLDKSKIEGTFDITIINWEESLKSNLAK